MQASPSSSPSSSPPSPPPPQQRSRSSPSNSNPPASLPSPPPACTACAGVTIYSRAHHEAGKPPSCLGVSRTRKQSPPGDADAAAEPTLLPPDVAPGGDFKFVCVGYAVCRDNANNTRKKAAERERERERGGAGAGAGSVSNDAPDDDDDDVELPACLGVQIIRAAAATPAAMPMRGAGGLSNAGSAKQPQQKPQPQPPPQQPRRAPLARGRGADAAAAPPPSLPAVPELLPSLLDAVDKFERSARRVAMRMGSNLVSIFGGRE